MKNSKCIQAFISLVNIVPIISTKLGGGAQGGFLVK